METTFFFHLIMLQKIIRYPLYLGNVSKDFTANNMKKTGLNGYMPTIFPLILLMNFHKYLMKKHDIK